MAPRHTHDSRPKLCIFNGTILSRSDNTLKPYLWSLDASLCYQRTLIIIIYDNIRSATYTRVHFFLSFCSGFFFYSKVTLLFPSDQTVLLIVRETERHATGLAPRHLSTTVDQSHRSLNRDCSKFTLSSLLPLYRVIVATIVGSP